MSRSPLGPSFVLAALLLAALAGACSSVDAAPPLPPGIDADASPPDAGPDAAPPLACAQTLDAYCATSPTPADCTPRDYAHACAALETSTADSGIPHAIGRCGDYDLLEMGGVDVARTRYFDPTTGALVAVVTSGVGGERCLAGPAKFALPECPGNGVAMCPSLGDASADAAHD